MKEQEYSQQKIRVQIDDFFVNICSLRLKTFLKHGITCSCCNNDGKFFAVERSPGSNSPYHLNLYGIGKDGDEILFTHDHIVARSLGGSDNISNTRTNCGPCNWKKGQLEHLIKNCHDIEEKEFLANQLEKFFPKFENYVKPKF